MEDRPLACPAVIDRPLQKSQQAGSLFSRQAGGPSSCAYGRKRSYAAAAFGAVVFFLGFAFFSSNLKPTFPFSNFR